MIILDTHIWIWHIQDDRRLTKKLADLIRSNESAGIGVSAISLWEVAKSVQRGHLYLPTDVEIWLEDAVAYPGIVVIPLNTRIAVESTRLPGSFHKDPADQLIVATSRVYDRPLLTVDTLILAYPHVRLLPTK